MHDDRDRSPLSSRTQPLLAMTVAGLLLVPLGVVVVGCGSDAGSNDGPGTTPDPAAADTARDAAGGDSARMMGPMPMGSPEEEAAQRALAQQQCRRIGEAVERYTLMYAELPEELANLMDGPPDSQAGHRPLLDDLPTDPWGNGYRFNVVSSADRTFVVVSLGPDGRLGGGDDVIYPQQRDDE